MKRNWCAVKSSRPVVAAAGIALIMVSVLGAGGPAVAARSTGPRLGWPRGLPDPFAVPGAALAGRSGELNGVFCTSADNCWAVGDYTTKTARLNQVLHWTGKKWFKVAVPEPAGAAKGDNDLIAVRCTSASNCWAVGSYQKSGKGSLDQIPHWTGKKWLAEHVPNPDGTGKNSDNGLVGVTCAAARDCWAVGSYGGVKTDTTRDQALHWTGTHWTLVTTPNPGGTGKADRNELNAVRCTAPANCWAVGVQHHADASNQDNALHWTGTKWLTG